MNEQDDSSTRMVLTGAEWLDVHFSACSSEYEAMVRLVGLQEGWHVLDAGCGAGSYLALLAELVGPTGRVTGIDFNERSMNAVQQRLATLQLPCPVSCETGNLLSLPFPDASFDALWSSNVTQYFSDEELPRLLAEFQRVVKPGGLVALKDVDMQLMRVYPANPFLFSHLNEQSVRGNTVTAQSQGSLRGRELRRWLEHSGLMQVWQRTVMIERWSPLRPVEQKLFSDWFAYLAHLAEERGVPTEDLGQWQRLTNPNAPDYLLDSPDFYVCEGQVVAVGHVPESR